ncbi:MAG: glycyl-radical enzyme activating protein [Bacteroidales bacterium]
MLVFNIQRYSTHDGDGIRTLVFFKGCPLRCRWCSNPESQSYSPSILFDPSLCQGFGDCLERFPGIIRDDPDHGRVIRRPEIRTPEELRELCVAKALHLSGESLSPIDILEKVRKDLPFYRNNGGVTLSGGEPLAQTGELDVLLDLLGAEGISVQVETSLHVSWEKIARTLGKVNTYLADVKHTDPVKYEAQTGGQVTLALDNFVRLDREGVRMIARIPVIPGFNDTKEEIGAILEFIGTRTRVREVHFLPFHQMGSNKYNMLGLSYALEGWASLDRADMAPYADQARAMGFQAQIGG